jgi:hypothetical protein
MIDEAEREFGEMANMMRAASAHVGNDYWIGPRRFDPNHVHEVTRGRS